MNGIVTENLASSPVLKWITSKGSRLECQKKPVFWVLIRNLWARKEKSIGNPFLLSSLPLWKLAWNLSFCLAALGKHLWTGTTIHYWELLKSDTTLIYQVKNNAVGAWLVSHVNTWTLLPGGLDWAREWWLPEENLFLVWIRHSVLHMWQLECGDPWLDMDRVHLS